jgi:hypothetical protein
MGGLSDTQFDSVPRFYGMRDASYESAAANPFAKAVRIAGNGVVEIEVPVETAAKFGLTFMAIPSVSATLVDASGVVGGKNLSDSPEANQWFRSIFVDRPTTVGTWKLRLESTADRETEVILTAWSMQ